MCPVTKHLVSRSPSAAKIKIVSVIKYTIMSIVCEASCRPAIWSFGNPDSGYSGHLVIQVVWVIWVILVTWVTQVIQVITIFNIRTTSQTNIQNPARELTVLSENHLSSVFCYNLQPIKCGCICGQNILYHLILLWSLGSLEPLLLTFCFKFMTRIYWKF